MYGKILEILKTEGMGNRTCDGSMDGYVVNTNKTQIAVLIGNGQGCCEDWGYFQSEDDLTPYIGAELYKIELTDLDRRKKALHEDYNCGGVQFVDFVTSKGVFQLAVYNAHNGYYGHEIAVVVDKKVIHEDTL